MRHFLSLEDFSADQANQILQLAIETQGAMAAGRDIRPNGWAYACTAVPETLATDASEL